MGVIQKEALRTTIYSYLGVVIGYINKIVLFIHLLNEEEIGLLNLLLSIGVLFSKLASFGTLNSTWRFYPVLFNKENRNYGFFSFQLLTVLIGAAFISLLLLVFNVPISNYYNQKSPLLVDYFYLSILIGFCLLIFGLFESFLKAKLKTVVSTFVNEVFLRLITTLLLILYALDLMAFDSFVLLYCISFVVPVLVLYFYLVYLKDWHVSLSSINIKSKMKRIIFNYSAYSYLNSFAHSIAFSLDALMIAGMLGLKETGIYTVVLYLTRPLTIPYSSIMKISTPLVPRYIKEKRMTDLGKLYKDVSSTSLIAGLYLFLCVWLNRSDLISLLPGEFAEGINVFLLLMVGKIVDMYFSINAVIVTSSKKYRIEIYLTAFLIIVLFVLNLVLIEPYGIVGAALATAIGFVLYNLMRGFYVWGAFNLHPFTVRNLKVLVMTALVTVPLEIWPFDLGNIWYNILVKGLGITLVFLGGIILWRAEPSFNDYINKLKKTYLKKST